MEMTPTERQGDIILAQGTYVLVQDGASGQVDVIVGPNKISLADTDKPVIYNTTTRRFDRVSSALDAIQVFPTAHEGQYIVLANPVKEDPNAEQKTNKHPGKGKQSPPALSIGHKINIPGPYTMPLYPSQIGKVIDGHQLKSNEYLVVRVYNEEAARQNFDQAIVKSAATADVSQKEDSIKKEDLVIGKLFIIKGTDVSFYIPPTGIEVIKDETNYVRKAVTLERLEYCILLDQNGDKRFLEGPAVVFPKPTELFVEQNGQTKFKAIELNDNMGIYVKVIADYGDEKSGDELFITGKETKIYFPRPEHAIIKYGEHVIHYAVAVPAGEAKYVLDKSNGNVKMVEGPVMLLPDPRKEVIVKRILDDKSVTLWFPTNREALDYNTSLRAQSLGEAGLGGSMNDVLARGISKSTVRFSAVADELQRSEKFTKPRAITLDTKYEGAICINVWPGYAVQVVKKTGEREVIVGPKVRLLDYQETLEILELSTGKPKTDQSMIKTVYLQTENNIVSDIIDADTKDSVNVKIRLSYRVNFNIKDKEKWFNVSNYVKLLTQHLRSLVRNQVKKVSIEEFNLDATDMIRDLILSKSDTATGKRPGRSFDENGMTVYDVEVLQLSIGDAAIADLLKNAQHKTVQENIRMQQREKELEFTKRNEEMTQAELTAKAVTRKMQDQVILDNILSVAKQKLAELTAEKERQEALNEISTEEISRVAAKQEQELKYIAEQADIEIKKVKEKNASITPGLIEALLTLGNIGFAETLAKNIKSQTSGLHGIFPKGGFDGLMETVKGTPLEEKLKMLNEGAVSPTEFHKNGNGKVS
jgi:major vault protein